MAESNRSPPDAIERENQGGNRSETASTQSPSATERFFCHTCRKPVTNVSAEFLCPDCSGGFLEKMEDDEYDDEIDGVGFHNENDLMQQIFQGMLGYMGPQANNNPGAGAEGGGAGQNNNMQNFLGNLLRNLNGPNVQVQFGTGGGQGPQGVFRFGAQAGGGAGGGGLPGLFGIPMAEGLHGNPQDYAWGPGGLDEIVTQLLNQIEGGVPPMTAAQIEAIPSVAVTKEQVEQKTQCTTCMEEFKLDEKVLKLPCKHCFHKDCIVPWLERHNSCPICRNTVDNSGSAKGGGGAGGPSSGGQSASQPPRGPSSNPSVQTAMDSIDELD